MTTKMTSFYNENLSDIIKERVGFPGRYFELSYSQRQFVEDLFDAAKEKHYQSEDLNEAMLSLEEQAGDLQDVTSELGDTLKSLRNSLNKLR